MQKYWWIVLVLVVVLALAVMQIAESCMPDGNLLGIILFLGLIGVGFYWVYTINRQRLWWAIIPSLAAFTLLAALLSDVLIGTNPQNDWLNVLVIGAGTAIITAVLKRNDAKFVLAIVTMFTVLVGFAMAPVSLVLKVLLITVDITVAGWYVWHKRSAASKEN